MLNYAYALLESQVRIAVVAQSWDPTIGCLHACRYQEQTAKGLMTLDELDEARS